MSLITLNVADFRAAFSAFANSTTFPDATIEAYFDVVPYYISNEDYGVLNGDKRARALYLLTAHMITLSLQVQAGETPQIMQSSAIDKISISVMPPPVKNQWQFWLATTPYGMELWALLTAHTAGGFSVGGLPETSAFRKVRGIF